MAELKRSLSLPLVVLYGLGVTIGAGIYVLLGAAAGRAGMYAPLSFVLAGIVMAFSAASFAELSARFPVSAGEAAYVRAGLQSNKLSLVVGFLVILSGVVSSAAITVGSTGYLREFIDWTPWFMILVVLVVVGGIAAWGIVESIVFASLFTIVEAGALIALIGTGIAVDPGIVGRFPEILPDMSDNMAWSGVLSAGLLAFFAFVGFEDIVNLAEEVKNPRKVLPLAILLTLIGAMGIYFLVTAVAVLSVPLDELAASDAPVSLVFGRIAGVSPVVVTLIAIVATLNGVVIQIVMASRVLYGLAKQNSIPSVFAHVHPVTQTPLIATVSVVFVVLILALFFPVENLAEWTSRIVLTVFALVNLSLFRIKRQEGVLPPDGFVAPIWVPIAGFLSCAAFLLGDLLV
ncbi:amino acid permease [Rhodospirillaceae bacterium KN72]|uniref:Amino acid permease n=1 Tax=Pacificispira spongiicola TaxID=2729598 RepID=A0A7Y0HFP2_9PROT|nr:amino acid permease [Pacificispira spongiicola]NMM46055.1 amino acid permease [Pacificispira spongiicola]